jgi:predicted ATPase
MLYKFKSKACADMIMLKEGGELVLSLIGKKGQTKGIIEIHELDIAIQAIEQALEINQQNEMNQLTGHSQSSDEDTLDAVTVRTRVIPFLNMLKECVRKKQVIVWGV